MSSRLLGTQGGRSLEQSPKVIKALKMVSVRIEIKMEIVGAQKWI